MFIPQLKNFTTVLPMPHLWSLKKYSDHFSRCVVASLSVRTRPLPYVKQSSSLWECFACVLTAAKQDHFFPQKIIYIHIFPCNAAHSQISLNIFVHVFVQVFPPYEKKKGGGGGEGGLYPREARSIYQQFLHGGGTFAECCQDGIVLLLWDLQHAQAC